MVDMAPIPITANETSDLSRVSVHQVEQHGHELRYGYGRVAAFVVDLYTFINCRVISECTDEYEPGIVIDRYDTLEEREDGSCLDHRRMYTLPFEGEPYMQECYEDYDADGVPLPYSGPANGIEKSEEDESETAGLNQWLGFDFSAREITFDEYVDLLKTLARINDSNVTYPKDEDLR